MAQHGAALTRCNFRICTDRPLPIWSCGGAANRLKLLSGYNFGDLDYAQLSCLGRSSCHWCTGDCRLRRLQHASYCVSQSNVTISCRHQSGYSDRLCITSFARYRNRTSQRMFVLCPPPKIESLQVFGKAANAAAGPACPAKVQGLAGLIGNTPLVRIASLSVATGCEVNASPASTLCHTGNRFN